MRVAILTVSDRGAAGQTVDRSGPAIAEELAGLNPNIAVTDVVPDDKKLISGKLRSYADDLEIDLVLTTGGTGIAPRDVTPEATAEVIDRPAPGLAEAMRQRSLEVTPHAMLSRAVSGVRGSTLIINLPGSPKACRECLETIRPALPHAVDLLRGEVDSCAQPDTPAHD